MTVSLENTIAGSAWSADHFLAFQRLLLITLTQLTVKETVLSQASDIDGNWKSVRGAFYLVQKFLEESFLWHGLWIGYL